MLDPIIERRIRAAHEKLLDAGEMPARARLLEIYGHFQNRFGPDTLSALEGGELLETLHDLGNRNSLGYWLEFKNDEEMPALFGSIAGGSSLKFGVYKRKETGVWMTGSSRSQRELTVDEAVEIATKHRDELVGGARHVRSLGDDPAEVDYDALQDEMERLAPSVSGLAWGHKYFALHAPIVLDDYHVNSYQDFHLIRMLRSPPERDGHYVRARDFALIAQHLGLLPTQLGRVLNSLNGSPYRHWRIGTTQGDASLWSSLLEGGYAGVGWSRLPSLSDIEKSREGKAELVGLLEDAYPDKTPQVRGRDKQQLFNFRHNASEGDVIVAMKGTSVLGVGRLTGDYYFEPAPKPAFRHRRPVDWSSTGDAWKLPENEALRTTFKQLKKTENLIAIERALLERTEGSPSARASAPRPSPLAGVVHQIDVALKRKGQVILYGPPGTGKTHHAEIASRELAARHWFGKAWSAIDDASVARLIEGTETAGPAIRTCCFHPAYGYEDFIEGYRPVVQGGALAFERRDGVFRQLCNDADDDPEHPYFLIIDEINRGDIPRIFGELLTVLERSRRGQPITLPLTGERFSVPENVFVIGTMNTADRSIALLDAALRRRFAFIELMPDSGVLGDTSVEGVPLGRWLRELNRRIVEHLGRDSRNLQVGHSYLMEGARPIRDFEKLRRALRMDVVPLLEEYCYEDYETLAAVLGPSFVDVRAQRIQDALFEPAQRAELVRALLEPTPDLMSSPAAPVEDVEEEVEEEADEDDA